MSTLANELIAFITADVSPPGEIVEPDTDLLLTGSVDSLGVVRIVQWIEERFGFQVDPADVTLDNFQTVTAMVAYVDAHRVATA